MLSDFFRINLPYGIAKNRNGEWTAFNREYLPLGFNKISLRSQIDLHGVTEYPIHTKYSGIKESTLLKLAFSDEGIEKGAAGDIIKVWFYNDKTNPMNDPKEWNTYFEKIKIVSNFAI